MARDQNRGLRKLVAERDGWTCAYCGVEVGEITGDWTDPDEMATLDHRIPRKRGGTDDLNNLVLACMPCNRRKRNRPVEVMFP